jgi:hypothetical protein
MQIEYSFKAERTDPVFPTHHDAYFGIATLKQTDLLPVLVARIPEAGCQKFIGRSQRGVVLFSEHERISFCAMGGE